MSTFDPIFYFKLQILLMESKNIFCLRAQVTLVTLLAQISRHR